MKLHQVPTLLLLAAAISSCATVLGSAPSEGDRPVSDTAPVANSTQTTANPNTKAPDDPTVTTGDDSLVATSSLPTHGTATTSTATEANTDSTGQTSIESDLTPALERFLYNHGTELQNTQYQVEYVDLNNDGAAEALVLLSGTYWCGTGGCNLAVFKHTANGFELVSQSSLIHAPVWVSTEITSGWRDLVIEVSGGGTEPKLVALKFSGSRYPANPSVEPEVDAAMTQQGEALFESQAF